MKHNTITKRVRKLTTTYQLIYFNGYADKVNGIVCEEIIVVNSLTDKSPVEKRKYFKDMLKHFNDTLKPGEYHRYYSNVKQQRIMEYANGEKKISFINIK